MCFKKFLEVGQKMNFNVEYITNTGLTREHNEDSILINNKVICNTNMNNPKSITIKNELLACVADGMGGHQKGEIASCFLLKKLSENINIKDEESLKTIFFMIKNKMDQLAQKNINYLNMGSVLAGVYINQKEVYVFNIGDSRVYTINHGYLEQLSHDHSFVFNLYENGTIPYEEISKHPKKNIVTSAFIANPNKNISEIFIKKFSIEKYKEFFICSDGIWELLSVEEIEQYLKQDNKMEIIKNSVLKNGANDNFSAVYIKGLK